jgi:hypothetical protein
LLVLLTAKAGDKDARTDGGKRSGFRRAEEEEEE